MKFKYHRWFQALVVPLVALAFHIFFGYRVSRNAKTSRRAAALSVRTMCSCPTRRLRRSHSAARRRCA